MYTMLQDQCLWTLGNIAANGDKCHDMLKDLGVVEPLVKLLNVRLSQMFDKLLISQFHLGSNHARKCHP